jgi:hypothetical protein
LDFPEGRQARTQGDQSFRAENWRRADREPEQRRTRQTRDDLGHRARGSSPRRASYKSSGDRERSSLSPDRVTIGEIPKKIAMIQARQAEGLFVPSKIAKLAKFCSNRFQPEYLIKEEKKLKLKERLEAKVYKSKSKIPISPTGAPQELTYKGWEHQKHAEDNLEAGGSSGKQNSSSKGEGEAANREEVVDIADKEDTTVTPKAKGKKVQRVVRGNTRWKGERTGDTRVVKSE